MTRRSEIADWFDRGVVDGKSHMLVAVDSFDNEDYPVYVQDAAAARSEYERLHGNNMQRVMEIYDLGMDKDTQLNEARAFHLPEESEPVDAPR